MRFEKSKKDLISQQINEDEQYNQWVKLGNQILITLKGAIKTGDPSSDLAKKVVAMHGEWLSFTLPKYTRDTHSILVQDYVNDERFAAYYNAIHPDAAEFLRDAIVIHNK